MEFELMTNQFVNNNELTTDQLCDIVETNDTEHGTMFVDQSVIDDFNIELINDVYIYNEKEYDCFSEIVCDNEEVEKAYQLALIELIENANWNK
jgi:hypothetical protein